MNSLKPYPAWAQPQPAAAGPGRLAAGQVTAGPRACWPPPPAPAHSCCYPPPCGSAHGSPPKTDAARPAEDEIFWAVKVVVAI